MKKTALIIIILLSDIIGYSQTLLTAKVIGIKDGDTVEVIDKLDKTTILRLAEVDCPEKKQPFCTKIIANHFCHIKATSNIHSKGF